MLDKGDVERELASLPLRESRVDVTRDGRNFVAIVISPTFASMPEAERQALVWGHLLARLSSDDLQRVEFVFTFTPSEWDELERESTATG